MKGATTVDQILDIARRNGVRLNAVTLIWDRRVLNSLKDKKAFSAIILMTPAPYINTGHWVALKRFNGKEYYFDSFGQPPPTNIMNILKGTTLYTQVRSHRSLAAVPTDRATLYTQVRSHRSLAAVPTDRATLYNNEQIQPFNANHCGEFCIAFLKHVKDEASFNSFLDDFHALAIF
jgi:hypothetical protein